jgi:hypothetical protein
MRLARPRFTIMSLMLVVVIVSVLLVGFLKFRDLQNRRLAVQLALANYQNATLTREVAEIAVTEYLEGIYKFDLEIIEGEIALAESDLQKSKAAPDLEAAELAEARRDRTRQQKATLEQYTKVKTVKELESEVTKAKAQELVRKATYDRSQALLKSRWW